MATQQFTAKARIQGVITIIYDQPGYTYDNIGTAYDAVLPIFNRLQTLFSRAYINVSNLQTISARARIRGIKTFSSKARILSPQRFTARARILRHQGWPIPDGADPGFSLWQDTRIYSRAWILHYIAFPIQTLRLKGRVTLSKTLSMQAKARIVTAQTMQMRANILPKFFTTHVPASFRVQQTSQSKLRMVFYTEGAVRTWQLTAKARIVQIYGSRVTGHFIVPMPQVFNTVLSITDPVVSTRTQQTLSTRAKVAK